MKKIGVGICGSIAAYKACDLVSLFVKEGIDVTVIMTKAATEFVSPITFETLSKNKVYVDMFLDDDHTKVNHIELAKEMDAFVIAPASYNMVGKVANGIADDFLSTVLAATKKPIFFAPAMNTNMYKNDTFKENLNDLQMKGHFIIEPINGLLACGDEGVGKMETPTIIKDIVIDELYGEKPLKGKTVLITAGATREYIDAIRYVTNKSSGLMGHSFARVCQKMGGNVTLIKTPNNLPAIAGVKEITVETSSEMYDAVMSEKNNADIIIKSAAVSDYTPLHRVEGKLKKSEGNLVIEFKRTKDILQELGNTKKPGQILIGFAAESSNLMENGQNKLFKKHLDYCIINNVSAMSSDKNEIVLLDKEGNTENFSGNKLIVAQKVINKIFK